MAKNSDLNKAKAKKDEFYTQLTDIEKEMRHYRDCFKNKSVFCNCDDPYESNFFQIFCNELQCVRLEKIDNDLLCHITRNRQRISILC